MATWKKVIVSGSNAVLNQVSASGGFHGDGSDLTSLPSQTDNNFTTAYLNIVESVETGATADQTAAEIKSLVGTGNSKFVPSAGTSGHFLKHDGTFGIPAYTTNTNTTYSVGDGGLSQNNFTNADHSKLDAIEASATADQSNAEIRTAVEAATDSNVFTDADHNKLNDIEANANAYSHPTTAGNKHIPTGGTVGQILKNTASGTATWQTDANTTYSVGDGGLTTNDFTNADHSKLNAIEASATADQTNAEIRTAVEAATDSNVFTDADHTKLNGIETSATADQTAAQMRTAIGTGNGNLVPAAGTSGHFLKHDGSFGIPAYTTNTNTTYSVQDGELSQNNFTNTDHSKLDAIEASATADQTAIEIINLLNSDLGGNKQIGNQASDLMTFGGSVTVTGDLTVSGATTTIDVTNLAVTDQFIELNDGGSAADGGLVVAGAGTSFGWDNSAGRWAFDAAGATANQTSITSDAFAASVVTSDLAAYRKNGNIRVESNEIYIYVE
tara:strand:+ start:199 stop:1698 length:1500 start_codon:yes stop_codon:yes gene_type:complete